MVYAPKGRASVVFCSQIARALKKCWHYRKTQKSLEQKHPSVILRSIESYLHRQ